MKPEHRVIVASVVLGLVFWVVDAVSDRIFFYDLTFLDSLVVKVPPHEVYIRSLAATFFIAAGLFASWSLTKRRQVEEKLVVAKARLEHLLVSSPAVIYSCRPGPNYTTTFVSENVRDQLGYDSADFITNLGFWGERIHPDDAPRVFNNLTRPLNDGCHVHEYRFVHRDGSYRWIYDEFKPIRDGKGAVVEIVGYWLDMTERKHAENAILQAKQEWERTFDAVPDLISIVDKEQRILRVNKAVTNRLGCTSEDLIGLPCYEVVHGCEEPPSFCPHARLLADGRDHSAEFHEDRLGGDFFITASPIHAVDGTLIGSVHVGHDISESKQAELQIKASLREKEILLREIHHRVRNNLQVVVSLLRLQSAHTSDKQHEEVLRDVTSRIQSMSLVHEKLYQTRDIANVHIGHYIEDICSSVFSLYLVDPTRIKLILEIGDVMFGIDQAIQCGLLVNELVSNSLKHAFPSDREGEIRIALREIGESGTELIVCDNGIGLPGDVDFPNTKTLGLQLVSLLAQEQLNGTIDLKRTSGTEYRIKFEPPTRM